LEVQSVARLDAIFPAVADGTIYFGSDDGNLYAVEYRGARA
jgi:outer membrane protein assembly factor BamB